MGSSNKQAESENAIAERRTSRGGQSRQPVVRGFLFFLVWLAFFALQLVYAPRVVAQGIVTTPIGSGDDEAFDVVIQPDDKIVVAGRSYNGTDNDVAVVRYNPDLSLDISFGVNGIVTTPVGASEDRANAVAIQSDGKIVVAGTSNQGASFDFAVVRYNPDGSPDGTFGTTGTVTTDIGVDSDDMARAVAIQPDGKIVVVGYTKSTGPYQFAIVRYNSDGSLDTLFDGDGIVTTSISASDDRAEAVAIQLDGKIVVAGDIGSGVFKDIGVVRYNVDGSLDGSFDLAGWTATDIAGQEDNARSVVIQPDGKIVVAGMTQGADFDFALVRYDPSGALDNGFGIGGIVTTDFGAGFDASFGVTVQTDGKIVAAGWANNVPDYDFALARYETNGVPDVGFGTAGRVTTSIGVGQDFGYGVALQADGRIVVAGSSDNGSNLDIALARYCPNGTLVSNAADTFNYRKTITIHASQVSGSSDLQDFPVLIDVTDPDLATATGKVQTADGADISFRAFCGGPQLAHEIEQYYASTGRIIAWVKVPTVYHDRETLLFMYYGNPNVGCSTENPARVWDSYRGVWHLDEDPAGGPPQFIDATSNANHGIAIDAPVQAPGKIDQSLWFDDIELDTFDRHALVPHDGSLTLPDAMTLSAWIASTDDESDEGAIAMKWGTLAADQNYWLGKINQTDLGFSVDGASEKVITNWALVKDGAFHQIVAVADPSMGQLLLYIDGILQLTAPYDGTSSSIGTGDFHIGNGVAVDQEFDGTIDEMRVSSVARTAAWIETEFNNQNSPSTFYTVGPEQVSPFCTYTYAYRKALTIDHTKVTCGSDVFDFPVLISLADPDLAHISWGGRVENGNGDDIVFRASDGRTRLLHEVEHYDPVTGNLVAWVRVPILSSSADTLIYLNYGNPDITSPQSDPSAVWDPSYRGVWHLQENGSGIPDEFKDSTSYGHHGHGGAGTSTWVPSQVAGKISQGQVFDGIDDHIFMGSPPGLELTSSAITLEAWVIYQDNPTAGWCGIVSKQGFDSGYRLLLDDNFNFGEVNWELTSQFGYEVQTLTTLTMSTWHHVVATYDGVTMKVFIDGVQDPNQTLRSGPLDATGNGFVIGHGDDEILQGWSYPLNGFVDEVRVSDVARSACWIETEYNNHDLPTKNPSCSDGGFVCVGPEELGTPTAVELLSFIATGGDGEVLLEWETASEVDNLGFYLYRSDAKSGPWARLNEVAVRGLGSSPVGAHYRYLDSGLANGKTYYYELEDFEASGKRERHGPVGATPKAGATTEPPDIDPETTGMAYGDPTLSSLQVVDQGPRHVVLELVTGGFFATAQTDGSTRISVPGFVEEWEPGSPAIPVKRTWVEALAGLNVRVSSIEAYGMSSFALRPAAAEGPAVEMSGRGVLRATRRQRRAGASYQAEGLYPESAARLVSVGFQEDVKKALLELAPLRWDRSSGRLILAQRLVVRVDFEGHAAAERSLGGARGRRYESPPRPNARRVVARLGTVDSGLYALSYEELFGQRGRGIDTSTLRLSRQGEAVAYHIEPAASRFAPGSVLYFVSEGERLNPYGNEAIYELELGEDGVSMESVSAQPLGIPNPYYWKRKEHEENRFYATSFETEPLWLWESVLSGAEASYQFEMTELAQADMPAELEIWLKGVSSREPDVTPRIRLYMNGILLSEETWDTDELHRLMVDVPPGALRNGTNELSLHNVSDSAYTAVMLDRYAVLVQREAIAESGALTGSWRSTGAAEVRGFSGKVHVVDVTGENARWLDIVQPIDGGARFQAESGHFYLLATVDSALKPSVHRASSGVLAWTGNQSDYLLIGPRELIGAAQPLLELRRNQGLRARAVALEDVYAEFGHGEPRPDALRAFLQYAYHEWRRPSIRYVVLLGDGTYDFKDYLGTGVKNHVPPHLEQTTYMWTASDGYYARLNGEDVLPDVSIGRLPVSTWEEAATVVQKIVSYEMSAQGFSGPVVLVADDPDPSGNFENAAEDLARGILKSRLPEHIYLSQLGPDGTRAAIVDVLDNGVGLMSYIGHGAVTFWAHENVFDTETVSTLSPQAEQPLLLTMNCLNGFFHFPYLDALAETLVNAEGKGAAAMVAPSGFSLNRYTHRFHRALLEEIVSGDHATLGDALLTAQTRYAEGGAFLELLAIFHLFGDPAMTLRP